jgi:hypothetical protein
MHPRRLLWQMGATLPALQCIAAVTAFAAPTSVTKNQDFNFGRVVGGAGLSGTVTITPAGARTYSGSVVPMGTSFSVARYTVTGTAGKTYTIILPTDFIINAGADQMAVTAITSSVPLTGVIPAAGTLPFAVGGTLNVKGVQRNTLYSGNMTITVK